jgi:hypothetical protein
VQAYRGFESLPLRHRFGTAKKSFEIRLFSNRRLSHGGAPRWGTLKLHFATSRRIFREKKSSAFAADVSDGRRLRTIRQAAARESRRDSQHSKIQKPPGRRRNIACSIVLNTGPRIRRVCVCPPRQLKRHPASVARHVSGPATSEAENISFMDLRSSVIVPLAGVDRVGPLRRSQRVIGSIADISINSTSGSKASRRWKAKR